MTFFVFCHLFRCARYQYLTTAGSTLRSNVNHPVRHLNHVHVVLDDNNRISFVDQNVQYAQQLLNVVEVQSRCWLVQYIKRLPRISLAQFS